MSRDELLYVDDLIEAADRVAILTKGREFDAFTHDIALHDAVLMNLLMIGEAVKHLAHIDLCDGVADRLESHRRNARPDCPQIFRAG